MEKITLNKYRTIDNGSLRITDAGKEVRLAGWVDTIRKLGELTFVVLRDTYGKTQVVKHLMFYFLMHILPLKRMSNFLLLRLYSLRFLSKQPQINMQKKN